MPLPEPEIQRCRRCGRAVPGADFEIFERMHYLCFHYEFEHGDIDVDMECSAGGCPSRHTGLNVALANWEDWDVAAFALGRAIGLYELPTDFQRVKHVFWTENAVGRGLHETLNHLAEAGILERRDEPDNQFRWKGASP